MKEITYQLVPQDTVVTVQRPFLKPVEIPIGRKTLTLETKCEPVIRKEIFGVLVPVEIKERKKACPCPPVPLPAPAAHPNNAPHRIACGLAIRIRPGGGSYPSARVLSIIGAGSRPRDW